MKNIKVNIDKTEINIAVRKSKTAKYVKLQLHPKRGFEVVLPYRAHNDYAYDIINKNTEWIEQVHNKSKKQQKKYYYLGELVTYQKFPNLFNSDSGLEFIFDEMKLLSEDLYDNFLRKSGMQYLPNRINEIANKMNLNFETLKIKGLVNRWGSCSSKKVITLNYRLMQFEPVLIDYVIVHELCHLKEMNHSAKFWKLVSEVFPNYVNLRKKIADYR
jgi:predicted metal-dependent hydrolase